MSYSAASSWKFMTLGSVASFINGYPFTPDEHEQSGLPVIRIEQLKDREAPADKSSAKLPDKFMLRNDDIVFSWSGSFVVQLWDRGPAWLNQHLFRVIPNGAVDNEFLAHLLNWSIDPISRQSHGTTMTHITRRVLLAHRVPIPPPDEQCRIAEILDTVDAEITSSERIKGKLAKAYSGLAADLFPWRPGCSAPTGWNLYLFNDISAAPICYGIIQAGPSCPGGVPVVMIRDLERGFNHDLHLTNPKIEANYARSRVSEGDVIVSVKGTIGRVASVPAGFTGNISRDVARVRPKSFARTPFIKWLLSTQGGQELLERAVVGTTRAEVSINVLKRLQVPIPSLAEQDRILGVVSSMEQRMLQEDKQLRMLRLLKQGLIDDLLAGRVRVTNRGMERVGTE